MQVWRNAGHVAHCFGARQTTTMPSLRQHQLTPLAGIEFRNSATSFEFSVGPGFQHHAFDWRFQDISIREVLSLRIACRANTVRGLWQIVLCSPQFDFGAEPNPVRPRFPEWHSYAAGVQHSKFAHHPIELHVRVPAYNDALLHSSEHRNETLFCCDSRKYLGIISRRRVTKQHGAKRRDVEAERWRPARHKPLVFRRKLFCIPANDWSKLLRYFF